ncbi:MULTISPECIES: DUF928 domain-containing protein [unclassified Moorena]|uniref:DUF928 domain-containing protein n=1 Tax=unclassified Moorena TaxID=2683338 RepID=UPI0013BC499C|nr:MULTISPECIES: DUF928 domain-containing protein [unclassified Moorena]NEP32571.1 DUF928 domain-containing protein [Moorena sp. SIO3B2]NEQ09141.1 DUF928 domain-containing protein [Moorena sp. SIO4E2]NER87805.1 DUF928 domain-containing protein [Moorena sp. SIO3A2]
MSKIKLPLAPPILGIALAIVSFSSSIALPGISTANPSNSRLDSNQRSPTAEVAQNHREQERITSRNPQPLGISLDWVPPNVPERGVPGKRKAAASRGGCPKVEPPLTALVPASPTIASEGQIASESVFGLTVVSHPTFWFYVPYALTPDLPLEFVLQDENHNEIYWTKFVASSSSPSVVGIELPSTVASLEVGKQYRWYFVVKCERLGSPVVTGWVKRMSLNPSLKNQLDQATLEQKAIIYARSGIWYDTLNALAKLRQQNYSNDLLIKDWVKLLQSVDLDAITQAPFLEF